MSLGEHVKDHTAAGSIDVSGSLGFAAMPEGYALMLDADRMYHYWLRDDGAESFIHWDKWAVYRWAQTDTTATRETA